MPVTVIMDTLKNLGSEAKKTALLFQACLGADKGVPSTLKPIKGGFQVTADDGKAVRFLA